MNLEVFADKMELIFLLRSNKYDAIKKILRQITEIVRFFRVLIFKF